MSQEEKGGKQEIEDVTMRQWLDDVFSYHPADEDQQKRYHRIREAAKGLATAIVCCCPPSPDRSAALRKLRESVMTANASVALRGKA